MQPDNTECIYSEKDTGLYQNKEEIAYGNKDDVNGKNMIFLFFLLQCHFLVLN